MQSNPIELDKSNVISLIFKSVSYETFLKTASVITFDLVYFIIAAIAHFFHFAALFKIIAYNSQLLIEVSSIAIFSQKFSGNTKELFFNSSVLFSLNSLKLDKWFLYWYYLLILS